MSFTLEIDPDECRERAARPSYARPTFPNRGLCVRLRSAIRRARRAVRSFFDEVRPVFLVLPLT